jgi:hypothetical protein
MADPLLTGPLNSHLVQSFREYDGFRGAHFYSEEGCQFLPWDEVVQFADSFPKDLHSEFKDKLLMTLANYDPDFEFLALSGSNDRVTIELYSKNFI